MPSTRALDAGRSRRRAARWIKAAADRVLAGVGLVLVAPLLLLLVAAVRLDSPGAALFRQVRVGRDGRLFTMYKLRSMTTGSETWRPEAGDDDVLCADGPLFKLRNDPRVTRLGRLLRRSSLDELPQLLNVLRGEMSLVGPRPALPTEASAYAPEERRRLLVRPGMTGLWQVSGRSDLSWEETVRLDLRYVDTWSLALDLWLIVRTVTAVLGRRGAY